MPASVTKELEILSGLLLRAVPSPGGAKHLLGLCTGTGTACGDALDAEAQRDRGITIQWVIALEDLILKSPSLEGVVLRYGQLYGPGTHSDRPSNSEPIHVDAAACRAAGDRPRQPRHLQYRPAEQTRCDRKGTYRIGLDCRLPPSGLTILRP